MLWENKIGKELLKIFLCFSLTIVLGKSVPAPTFVVTLSSAPCRLNRKIRAAQKPCAYEEPKKKTSLGPNQLRTVPHLHLLLYLPWASEVQPKDCYS